MSDDEKDELIDPTNIIEDLNLLPITPTKRRRRRQKIDWDVNRFQEARLNKAKFLLNLEEYKKSKELEKEAKKLVQSKTLQPVETSIPIKTSPCLEETFNPDLFGAYYTYDEVFHSAGKKLPSEDSDDEFADPDYFPPALTHRTYSMDCKFQFKVMATVPDDITAKSCYRTLVLNEFAVPFVDILTVFLNWGASVESLGISSMPVGNLNLPVGNLNLPVMPQKRNCCGRLSCHNVEYVLKYIQHFHSAWQSNEIIILVLVLISAALDKTLRRCYNLFLGALSRLLHRLENIELIQTASFLIKNFKFMDILNALFVCVNLIPVSDKGNLFSTTASNGLLQLILGREFPTEDDSVWNVLDMLVEDQRDPNSYFQHLYIVINLVENITIKRFKNNSECQEINLKNVTIILRSATNLQTNIKYTNKSNHLDNLHMIKEILARLINHNEKLLQTLRHAEHYNAGL